MENECSHSCSWKLFGNWIDITPKFQEAVKDLKLGQLLHDDLFGLFDAMTAIEMMDPKMDAGMLCNRGIRKIVSFDQAVQDNILKLEGFSYKEIIGIIDSTFACLVSWLEGHSLAQTVFINLYLHKPYMIGDRTLKAFCLAMYKLLEVIKDLVHNGMVYEEEDFQPMQYGYHLNPDISEQRMIGMLREVEEDLHRKTRSQPNHEIHAVFGRIKFLRIFLQVLISCFRKEDQPPISESHRLLNSCLDMLYIIQNTVGLGIKSEDPENEYILGFEPSINHRLLPPTFPRYTKIKSRHEAITYFIEMAERFKIVSKIQLITSLHQALDFFIDFSKSSPCILSRSALQLMYSRSFPANLKDILRESVKSFICPPALLSKTLLNNPEAKHYVDTFLSHCSRPFINFLQLCGHNRARQRDKLAHILEEFTSLQDEAERVDAYLHNLSVNSSLSRPHIACFGTWILYHTLRIMIMYLLAGFELELYSVHEFYYIYWYLYEFLYGWLISALSRADSFLVENELLNELHKNKGTSKKKPKYKKKARPYNKDIIYLQALQNMCGGYYKALMGFRLEGKLTMPHPRFDSEQIRYEHRFAPFQNLLTPPPVVYSEFREMTSFERFQQQPVDSVFLYIAGCKHFHQARQLLESIIPDNEITDLLTICKTNFIVLKLLAGGHKKDSLKQPEFDFSRSKYFSIIKIS
ncbi:N-alpha-acetyltransferase 35, NatC auxiliary subunit [Diorhabda carinulata]|uniref:N-alpha-acetyltransferase 35, NatC auxiliary subunit n=1 Tax=Diorhabda sublineata TaxID=1163346 RepID=UPI0024E0D356|nr:N-alpha-acetyltransferase 35, NatC auxiliary subunit [Diorhabda sublineata]XP_057668613.1 N-alpha-acetyltransferase 35, NatC auxiliary subunit [Diorhabda carinulata]